MTITFESEGDDRLVTTLTGTFHQAALQGWLRQLRSGIATDFGQLC
jgi:hypothetical protein